MSNIKGLEASKLQRKHHVKHHKNDTETSLRHHRDITETHIQQCKQ